MPLICYRLCMC